VSLKKSNQQIKNDRINQIIDTEIPPYHKEFFLEILKARHHGIVSEIEKKYKRLPVPANVFIAEDTLLGTPNALYPEIMKCMLELNNGKYTEAVLTGSIGCGKTTLALYTTAYQLYLLSCLRTPHEQFGLDPASEIIFIFQSINAGLAKQVDFARFKAMVENSEYFTKHFMFDKNLESKLKFPNRIEVIPVSGQETAAIGQNVIGGVIDELNYMAVTERSKNSVDGGTYDQAVALYNSLARRRKSRFMSKGSLPGVLCLVSSKRYPGQFTDIKMDEAETEIERDGKTTIYVYDKRSWDVIPPDRFLGGRFNVFIGDESKKPYILKNEKDLKRHKDELELVISVPVEYRTEFETDIMNSLREIAGVSTLAKHPFMVNTEKVAEAFQPNHLSILSRELVDFKDTQLAIYPDRFRDLQEPRWVHLDLALTGDSAGISMGYIKNFKSIKRGELENEILPNIKMDFTLEIEPPKGDEIQFHKLRSLIYKLSEYGVIIKWVSLDSFQSSDFLQILRVKGYKTGLISLDRTTMPYNILKTCIYDGRLTTPEHPKLKHELLSLEIDQKKGKIDHPSTSTKDVSDSLGGVVYGLTTRKELWFKHGISFNKVPQSVVGALESQAAADNMKGGQ